MSVNLYNKTAKTLTTVAGGQRLWIGSAAAHATEEAQNKLPLNALIAILGQGLYFRDNNGNETLLSATGGGSPASFDILVVNELPTTNIQNNTIYLVRTGDASLYHEYIYVNNEWVDLGNYTVTLSEYVTIEKLTNLQLTGDVTGTLTTDNGDYVIPTTLAAISGLTAGTYGTNSVTTITPSANTFVVPTVTVDNKGRVTAAADQILTLDVGAIKTEVFSSLSGDGTYINVTPTTINNVTTYTISLDTTNISTGSGGVGENIGAHNERFNDYSTNTLTTANGGDYNTIIGYNNTLQENANVGVTSSSRAPQNTFVSGRDHNVYGGTDTVVFGQQNTIRSANEVLVTGAYNNSQYASYSLIAGFNNFANNGSSKIVLGKGLQANQNISTGQVVLGYYNTDTTDLLVVGNGTSSVRSNAMWVTSTGDLYVSGDIYYNSTTKVVNGGSGSGSNEQTEYEVMASPDNDYIIVTKDTQTHTGQTDFYIKLDYDKLVAALVAGGYLSATVTNMVMIQQEE